MTNPDDDEPRYAFTALASAAPPPEAYHTYDEWMELIAETERVTSQSPHEDIITRRWNTTAIWAKRNGKTG